VIDVQPLVAFLIASAALLLMPGPAVLFVVARAAQHGRRAGLVATAGLSAGAAVHVIAAVVGLSALLAKSALAFNGVRLLGAAYLIYLGVKSLRTPVTSTVHPADGRRSRDHLLDGFVVNVLNPKTAMFFLAFLPQFVTPLGPPAHLQMLFLGSVFVFLALITDSGYALAANRAWGLLIATPRVQRLGRYFSAVAYFGLGLSAALTGRRTD
jgi:threonine/homoserine/homoserine lactone efflux protein